MEAKFLAMAKQEFEEKLKAQVEAAERAATGRYLENGEISLKHQRNDVKAESKSRPDEV